MSRTPRSAAAKPPAGRGKKGSAKPATGRSKAKAAKPAKAPLRRGKAVTAHDPSLIAPGDSLAPFADLLLPYQVKYLRDRSPMKKWVKSRRVGGTWTQSLEDVLDCVEKPGLKVWFSSADLDAAKGYLEYVRMWVQVANLLVQIVVVQEDYAETDGAATDAVEVADPTKATTTVVEFHNGSRISVLSSNPTAFRSKGGKVVIDEFAHHGRDRALWQAAQPVAGAWGYDIRILSTLNGKGNAFYRLGNPEFNRPDPDQDEEAIEDEDEDEEGLKTDWSVHTVTIDQAVEEGMYDRVMGRPTTEKERARFIRKLRRQCLTQEQFDEEFRCIPNDEAHALLPYPLIEQAERDEIAFVCSLDGKDPASEAAKSRPILGLDQVKGPLYVGMDIGRKKDLAVIYAAEVVDRVLVTRCMIEMAKTRFAVQKEMLWQLLSHPRFVRASIDANGLGAQLAEEAQERFGVYRIDDVVPTLAINDALATRLVQEFEDSTIQIPRHKRQKEGLHAVRKTVSSTNKARYDAKHDEENGHADHFWALAHCIAAARTGGEAPASAISMPAARTGSTHFGGMSYSSSHLSSWAHMK